MMDFVFQITLVALAFAVWIDVARMHRRLKKIEELLTYTYYAAYYAYHQAAGGEKEEKDEEDAVVVGNEVVLGDVDKVKESCILELVSRRGCVPMEEAASLCNVSKFFIRKLSRMKVVRLDREGRVCPRE